MGASAFNRLKALTRWAGFLRRNRLEALELAIAADGMPTFVGDPWEALARGEAFTKHWPPGGPWAGEGRGE